MAGAASSYLDNDAQHDERANGGRGRGDIQTTSTYTGTLPPAARSLGRVEGGPIVDTIHGRTDGLRGRSLGSSSRARDEPVSPGVRCLFAWERADGGGVSGTIKSIESERDVSSNHGASACGAVCIVHGAGKQARARARRRMNGSARMSPPQRTRLILLELSPEDEHPVPIRLCAQLLQAAHALEPLWTPALCENDVNLEPVADLYEERE